MKGDCTLTGDSDFEDAAGCRINPFGDIGLGRPAGAVTTRVYCAGLNDAQNVLLTRDLGPGGLWQVLA